MPVFQIGLDDGRSLRIEADDQAAALAGVQHFQESEKPSGVGSAFAKGVSDTAGGLASTLGLAGIKADALKKIEEGTAPKDYKAAPLIREGGHWYNPADYQPGNLPQIAAQALPGMAQDFAAGKTGAYIGNKVGGARGALIGGAGSVLASIAARTFGKGAHENAEARTGDANAEVTGADMLREGGKQLIAAPLNAFGGARLAGVAGKAAGVGLSGAGKAVMNQLGTMGAEGAAGGVTNAVNQLGTSVGQEHGKPFDANQVAEAAAGSGLTSGALVAPRMYGQLKNAGKFRDFGGDNARASADLANDINTAADGSELVGKLGGTKTAAHATDTAVRNTNLDLAAAAKDVELSPDNAKTLQRIQSGGKANGSELAALDAEAPDVGHLARKALIGAKLKGMGNFSENSFSGGLSGMMDKSVKAIANPIGAAAVAGSSAIAGSTGVLGSVGLPVLGTIGGGYLAARTLDKLTGARSPAKGFTDTFADPNAPGRPPAPTPTQDDFDPNYDPTTLRQELNTNAKLEDGIAKIAGKLSAEKRKALLAEAKPLLSQLAATRAEPEAPAAPEMPSISPVALKMTQARLKAGLPPIEEPAATPEPAPPPPVVISPIAKKMLQEKLKAGLPPEPAPIAPEPAPAPEAPSFNPTALSMLKQKLKTGLPPLEAPAPLSPDATAAAVPPTGPASDAIGVLMAQLRAKSAAGVQQAPAAPQAAPVAPKPDNVVTFDEPFSPRQSPNSPAMVFNRAYMLARGHGAVSPALLQKELGMAPEDAQAMFNDLHNSKIINERGKFVAEDPVQDNAADPLAQASAELRKKLRENSFDRGSQPALKISKKSGEDVKQTPHEDAYVPMDEADLYRKFMTDEQMVEHEYGKYEPTLKKRYGETSIENREGHREDTLNATAEHSAEDRALAKQLYNRLDHIKTAEEAQKAIDYYTAKMSPDAAAAINERYTAKKLAQRWKPKKK